MRNVLYSSSLLVLLGLVPLACGSKDGSEVNGGKGSGASSSTGATMPDLGPIDGSGANGNGSGGTTGSGVTIKPGSECAKGTATAALAGVNMIVMFDRSSSMNQEANPDGDTRWEMASSALTAFFADPSAAGLKLALRFFPHDQPSDGCNQDGCNVNACAMPLVPLGTLTAEAAPGDAHEKALLDATAASAPGMAGMGTPISAALGGALQWAAAQRQSTPDENSVVVLVTDGQANGCDENIGRIAGLAADALAEDGIRTYAIGLTGSEENDMDRIARAGGTEQGIFVADGATAKQDLLNALGQIRGEVLDCDFPMPEPEDGMQVNPNVINVNYTPGGGMLTTLIQVGAEADCGTNQAWYYDDAMDPTRIILCKSACDTITADPMAALEILLGCPTSTQVPK